MSSSKIKKASKLTCVPVISYKSSFKVKETELLQLSFSSKYGALQLQQ